MTEELECPYCGSIVRTDRALDYDNKVKLRCGSCGGMFEYLPGFGAFSIPETEQRSSVRSEGSFPAYYYESDTPWDSEARPAQQGGGACCGVIFCICFILPIIWFMFAIIFGFGWLWFWF